MVTPDRRRIIERLQVRFGVSQRRVCRVVGQHRSTERRAKAPMSPGRAAIERLVASRGEPAHLRMDNGPELTAAALRDWCRIWGTHTAYIEPGSPWETPFVESFNGRLRDECLNIEDFANITEAKAVLEDTLTLTDPATRSRQRQRSGDGRCALLAVRGPLGN